MTAAEHRRQLYLWLEAGTPFGDIEDWIETLPILDDAKAGLWLLAWAEQGRSGQRQIAEQTLAAVEP